MLTVRLLSVVTGRHQSAKTIASHPGCEAPRRKRNSSRSALQWAQHEQNSFAYSMAASFVLNLSNDERNVFLKPPRFDLFSP